MRPSHTILGCTHKRLVQKHHNMHMVAGIMMLKNLIYPYVAKLAYVNHEKDSLNHQITIASEESLIYKYQQI